MEYREKFERVPNEDLVRISSKEAETCEFNRMKHNAFKVCEEVSQRVDGGVAPGGYIKAWVTPDKDNNQSEVSFPGENYYRKVENFMKDHFRMGEKYSEFLRNLVAKNL